MPITKTERRAALKRTIDFKKWFSSLDEADVDLQDWYIDLMSPLFDLQHCPDRLKNLNCGSVGCLGGHAQHSELFAQYKNTFGKTNPNKQIDAKPIYEQLYSFFGVTPIQADKRDLFSPSMRDNNNVYKTDKAEAIGRLTRLISWHKKALA